MKPLFIVGAGLTDFGELWGMSLEALFSQAMTAAIQSSGLRPGQIEAVYVANMAAEAYEGQAHLGPLVSALLPHHPPAMRVEGACASGSLALLSAEAALLAGLYKTVLVIGAEKMTDASAAESTRILAGAADIHREQGSTFPGLYALLAQQHMAKYGTTRDQLSAVSVKNHQHALKNPHAQFHKALTAEQIEQSPLIADPLRLLDCSPISDGAAAILLSTNTTDNALARITGFGHACDSLDLAHRESLTSLAATKRAAKDAFAMAKTSVSHIEAAEVHDCFTIAELLALEDIGFFAPGEAGSATLRGETKHGGKLVINPSGGLKGCGHPVGATGIKQVAYLAQEIAQEKYQRTLAHNVGGSGATAVVHIVEAL